VPVAGFFGSGKTAEELPEHTKKGFEAAPKSVWDPAERLKEQEADGVSAEVLYPTLGLTLFGLDDARLQEAWAFPESAGAASGFNRRLRFLRKSQSCQSL